MKKSLVLMMLLLALALTACGGDSGGDSDVDSSSADAASLSVARGEELYNQTVIGPVSSPGCITCHSLEPDIVLVGPSHYGVGARAGEYVEGMSAEEYMYESILDSDSHLVEGHVAGVMYQNYADELEPSEVDDLVAFLLTQ